MYVTVHATDQLTSTPCPQCCTLTGVVCLCTSRQRTHVPWVHTPHVQRWVERHVNTSRHLRHRDFGRSIVQCLGLAPVTACVRPRTELPLVDSQLQLLVRAWVVHVSCVWQIWAYDVAQRFVH